ncbi:hypothetical protein HMI56_002665 [Coelomomyces lativittatus]|nr:hypothetical protein HMI56_002665 [Coelomomyces lativittatus]
MSTPNPKPSPLPDSGLLSFSTPPPTQSFASPPVPNDLPVIPKPTSTASSTLDRALQMLNFHTDNLILVPPLLQVSDPPIIPSFQEQPSLPKTSSSAQVSLLVPDCSPGKTSIPALSPSSPLNPVPSATSLISSLVLSASPQMVIKCVSLKMDKPSPSCLSP